MRLARFFGQCILAAFSLYAAAVLTVGPGQAGANLCAWIEHAPWLSRFACHDHLGAAVFWVAIAIASICIIAILWDIFRWTLANRRAKEYTPLYEAALLAHDSVSDDVADIGRHTYSGNNPNRILEWWGYVFAPKLVIYGKRSPSRIREIYSDRTHRNDYDLSASDGRTVARERHGHGLWTDLEVRTSELTTLIKKLKKEHGKREVGEQAGQLTR
jgi:hypothetical protein